MVVDFSHTKSAEHLPGGLELGYRGGVSNGDVMEIRTEELISFLLCFLLALQCFLLDLFLQLLLFLVDIFEVQEKWQRRLGAFFVALDSVSGLDLIVVN